MADERIEARLAAKLRGPGAGLRQWIDGFIARHALAWEITFAFLALIYVALAFIGESLTGESAAFIATVDVTLTIIFVVEFVGRLWAAPDRREHLRQHWVDALALVPAVRAFRLLRLLRLVRVFSGVYRAGMDFERLARHRSFLSVLGTWLAIGFLCTVAFFAAEGGGANQRMTSVWDAVWWGVSNLTRVGSEVFPVTPEGRIASMALAIAGLFLVSAITATITSFLIGGSGGAKGASVDLVDSLARASDLHAEGRLTDDEFARAKAELLGAAAPWEGRTPWRVGPPTT